ncbi:MAG: type II toxin-antitoxin system PemK/MazF family toxin [Microcoleus sp. PH2017_29_MFU_D_A]|uniref:type II toxin-antitoxin system PemK/MazF family toxin n=1 Tax=unclassified Microcoleus TaxID=2642155 RepID=UPI001D47B8E6|nr:MULTISPECIES: type II toxin-antitoxin system PemK/MazF family toxin [unclassified Microcoleus]MCC3417298.1 type II toxin-antitoxin system PemK/MazF family toxin [Microcoleus sp. PH2017_07_MST_O_A]MCC3513345.1 type II toxin-antitoxin system PemK/MazF family toxin [Microcoleus sp. PH2017_17_BER_D_A]MCC3516039.1 type II toxin-antitoxin system PemK/MazF family toxin [Microcoleus sp. PH2017_18_LLB_O_A]MCC3606898.1 type II toxin-antitoxin system PemK/MazF family toxin [Microcoleus sp. PH2017_29_MF
MPNYQSGEVLLLALPFANVTTSKLRPVLVLLDTGDEDIVVARVTSQTTRTVFDVEIVEWEQAGLLRLSVVRLHKVNTIEKRLVNRRLGILTPSDWTQVIEKI